MAIGCDSLERFYPNTSRIDARAFYNLISRAAKRCLRHVHCSRRPLAAELSGRSAIESRKEGGSGGETYRRRVARW